MLTKNIYIVFPAGYSGSFMNWAIHASDTDLCKQTVVSPINLADNSIYGGIGTSHLHHRTPTHQGIRQHLPWMIYNKPTLPKIFTINGDHSGVDEIVFSVLAYDIDPVFIFVHDNHDPDIRSYGQINCATKWPVFFSAQAATNGKKITFDPFNFSDDINFRNLSAENQVGFLNMYPLDNIVLDQVKSYYTDYLNWLKIRNTYNPHEVNTNQYLFRESFPDNCIFQVSCLDIVSKDFPTILHNILTESQCLSSFDTQKIIPVHQDYIKAQKNLQWFESIRTWRLTGKLDDYLLSHSAIQGMVISQILHDCEWVDKHPTTGNDPLGYMKWQAFYYRIKDSSWPDCDHEQDFYLLPKKIQTEIIKNFNYTPQFSTDVQRANCRKALADWKNLSLDDINTIYQSYKNNFSILSNVS